MLETWKWSTGGFVLQAVFGVAVYTATESIPAAVAFAAVVALIISVTGGLNSRVFACSAAFFAAFSVTVANFMFDGSAFDVALVATVAVLAVLCSAATAVVAKVDEKVKEPFSLLFVTALPVGLGAILGGTALLHRRWKNFREQAGWDG